MNPISKIIRDVKFIVKSKKMLAAVEDVKAESHNLLTDDFERAVDAFKDRPAFESETGAWTYGEFDAYANQVAHWGLAQGLVPGDTVAFFSNNRLEYVAVWFGLSKIGVISALINFQLRGKSLAHCVNIAKCKLAIVEADIQKSWASAKSHLDNDLATFIAFNGGAFDQAIRTQSQDRPQRDIRQNIVAGDTMLKMFTSGTTGLPKAAKMPHTRGQYYSRGFIIPSGATKDDRMMIVLPLYHATGGICGVGVALLQGGCLIIRRKFSVSGFWRDARNSKATMFMYVGELCRFLLNAPPSKDDRDHCVRCIVGNGLRPEIWEDFTARFGIDKVVEFYGATEGNVSLINLDGKVGTVGRVPEYLRKNFNGDIVRYDIETGTYPRDENGFFIRTKPGEVGELIGEVRQDETRFRYDGYENKKASAKKLLHNVFKQGDVWFHTGDLFRRDKDGYYAFVDRMGDTFRWKAENVSTNEVAGVIAAHPGVLQANVYGVPVPGYDGKAGMASIVVAPEFNLEDLRTHIHKSLPVYARPLFIRISNESDTTTTFKYKKTALVKDGFDPTKVKDDLY
ncbi:MAG TPA: long-chain-acyl-CoA synthetase, partial [Hellea balneolensis]|nr:long-chain-acyl-CoA synthetase [Hellea balneolensis]